MNNFFEELNKAHWLIKILVFGGYLYFWRCVINIIDATIKIIKNSKKEN